MRYLRLLVVACTCLFPLIFSHTGHAASVLYSYTGNTFDTNDTTNTLCAIGASGCFNNITATIELPTALGINQPLSTVAWDAWSISDGLTTITDLTTDFSLSGSLQVGTDNNGDINKWQFIVQRITGAAQPQDELVYMQTTNSSGQNDSTGYCRTSSGTSCSYTAVAQVNNDPGSWAVSTVPLPAAAWLFGSGLLGLFGLSRRR